MVDFSAQGYFNSSKVFVAGMPSADYLPRPTTLTATELAQLQKDCIDRINMYRSGELKFSDGSSDPGVPKPPITPFQGNARCSSAMALGDLYANGGRGGCTAAHGTAFSCAGGNAGQNTCCFRSGSTYLGIRSQLYSCLQSMWNEGIGLPDNTAFDHANGHWYNMRRTANVYAACGFGFDDGGHVWMSQDFWTSPGQVPVACSCAGKNIGDSDGCGGTCVAG